MAGRLSSKLRSVMRKMNSFGNNNNNNKNKRLSRGNSFESSSSSSSSTVEQRGLQKVYVGRSRREYQVPSELLDHPVMRELIVDTSAKDDSSVIGCEVVMFDHLCWMLEDNTSSDVDLASFYAYY